MRCSTVAAGANCPPDPPGRAVAKNSPGGCSHGLGTDEDLHPHLRSVLTWLLPATNSFPRAHRHTFTARLLAAAFDLRERLEEANLRKGQARLEKLRQADEALARLRLYLRLAVHWRWISEGQYWHAARLFSEMGNLLGGWLRQTREAG
jgi:hypothetical protein